MLLSSAAGTMDADDHEPQRKRAKLYIHLVGPDEAKAPAAHQARGAPARAIDGGDEDDDEVMVVEATESSLGARKPSSSLSSAAAAGAAPQPADTGASDIIEISEDEEDDGGGSTFKDGARKAATLKVGPESGEPSSARATGSSSAGARKRPLAHADDRGGSSSSSDGGGGGGCESASSAGGHDSGVSSRSSAAAAAAAGGGAAAGGDEHHYPPRGAHRPAHSGMGSLTAQIPHVAPLDDAYDAAEHAAKQAHLPLLPYYLGHVRGLGVCENEQTLAIEDVIAGEYTHAVLMNFMFGLPWMINTLPRLASVPWLCAHGDEVDKACVQEHQNISLFKPELMGAFNHGTHHSKVVLLFFPTGIRVAVVTANFIEIDWRNKTEGVWVQDFPKLPPGSADDDSEFGKDLRDYVTQLNTFKNVEAPGRPTGHPRLRQCLEELRRFDFRHATALLVPSVPGKHKGRSIAKYGYMRLRRLLEREGIDPSFQPANSRRCGVVAQFSSFPSHAHDGKWVKEEFEPTLKSQSSSPRLPSHIIWPTMDDTKQSIEGWRAGWAMPCRPSNVYANKFAPTGPLHGYIRERICRFHAQPWGRQRAMPHLKSFVRYAIDGDGPWKDVVRLAWVLITSHNYSVSAWGKFQDRGQDFKIQSFEMGVLFVPSLFTSTRLSRTFSLTPEHPLLGVVGEGGSGEGSPMRGMYAADMHQAKHVRSDGLLACPIPYRIPPAAYDFRTDKPWSSYTPCNEQDSLGKTLKLCSDGVVRPV